MTFIPLLGRVLLRGKPEKPIARTARPRLREVLLSRGRLRHRPPQDGARARHCCSWFWAACSLASLEAAVLPAGSAVSVVRGRLAARGRIHRRHPGSRHPRPSKPSATPRAIELQSLTTFRRRRRPALLVLRAAGAAAAELRADRCASERQARHAPFGSRRCSMRCRRAVPGARVDVRELETGKPVGIPGVHSRFRQRHSGACASKRQRLKRILQRDSHCRARARRLGRRHASPCGSRSIPTAPAWPASPTRMSPMRPRARWAALPVGACAKAIARFRWSPPLRLEERAQLGDLENLYVYSRQCARSAFRCARWRRSPTAWSRLKIRRHNQFRTITVSAFPSAGALPSEVTDALCRRSRRSRAPCRPATGWRSPASTKSRSPASANWRW